ncbi:MAG: ribosome recycling factor [Rhodoluna sp.]|uniref:ribosome recycling factor n=1 Tax=Aurantimicrobium minutum TaxID=708131 RepID=UPI002476625C|nr:ribosome recycling factor [Aurantimicrobium minutum]MDH6277458.1 ribosome recycling factor [Aurantimicrobium minutum]
MIAEVLSDASERMAKAVDVAKEDFSSVRTGRANPAMFQKVMVTYYGSPTPLAQLASMQNPEARTLLITPFDKTALRDIEQALRDVPNLDANPTNDGNVIRLTMPELTEERRKEYVKIVKTKAEDAKVSLRNIRRSAKDGIDALKGELGDDERARGEKELEALTKKYVDAIDDALKHKEAELLKV